jgi:hypothetical protein
MLDGMLRPAHSHGEASARTGRFGGRRSGIPLGSDSLQYSQSGAAGQGRIFQGWTADDADGADFCGFWVKGFGGGGAGVTVTGTTESGQPQFGLPVTVTPATRPFSLESAGTSSVMVGEGRCTGGDGSPRASFIPVVRLDKQDYTL